MESSEVNLRPRLINGKIVWPGGEPVRQPFAFPFYMMEKMADRPSSVKAYKKVIKSTKYFFTKNPIVIFNNMHTAARSTMVKVIDDKYQRRNMDFNTLGCKLWFTGMVDININVHADYLENLNTIIQRIHACKMLNLSSTLPITFPTAIELFSTATFLFISAPIVDETGTNVTIADVLRSIGSTNAELVSLQCDNHWMLGALDSLGSLGSLKEIALRRLPLSTSFEELLEFAQKYPKVHLKLDYRHKTYPIETQLKLDEIADTIIESNGTNLVIVYDNMNSTRAIWMHRLNKNFRL